jgi:hypothetical protein
MTEYSIVEEFTGKSLLQVKHNCGKEQILSSGIGIVF